MESVETASIVQDTTVQSLVVTLPDREDTDALVNLAQTLPDKFGSKKLAKSINRYLMHIEHTNKCWQAVNKSAQVVNGLRTKRQRTGDSKRSLKSSAHKYFSSLSTPALRMQCTLFNLNFDAFDSIESIVEALVAKNVEMANSN